MTPIGVCPQRTTLESLSLGKLAEAELSDVASHVEQCISCQSVLASLETDAEQKRLHRGLKEAGATEEVSSFKPATDVLPASESKSPSKRPPPRLGQYDLLEKLGEGGMGAVYQARHRKLDRIVAIKVLPSERLQDSQAVDRFHREMLVLGRLEHPHIVRAHDAGEDQGVHFLVMEHVAGCDLAEFVRRRGPLPPGEACEYLCQAAAGLAYAHQAGILHRDVKPSNLLRDGQTGRIKVLDLGLAKVVSKRSQQAATMTAAGEVFGTVDFMAPEQGLDVGSVDARADVYSLGCTLYYLLTGKRLFEGDIAERMIAHRIRQAPKLGSCRADISKSLERVFQKMIAKKPAERFGTMDEVIAALRPFAEPVLSAGSEDTTKSTPRVVGDMSPAAVWRRPRVLAAVSAIVAAAAGIAVWNALRDPVVAPTGPTPAGHVENVPGEATPGLAVAPFDGNFAKQHQEKWAVHLATPITTTNSAGMRMVVVPPGKFQMGSSRDETQRFLKNKGPAKFGFNLQENLNFVHDQMTRAAEPPHEVVVSNPLLVGATEVTVGQFRKYIEARKQSAPAGAEAKFTVAEKNDSGQVWLNSDWVEATGVSWRSPERGLDGSQQAEPLSDDLPVVQLTRLDMAEFCNWLSRNENLPEAYEISNNVARLKDVEESEGKCSLRGTIEGYRLPTEAEWEYFCRAGSTTTYFWGDTFGDSGRFGHFEPDELKRRLIGGTTVGMKDPNWFGLFDIAGNVSEMCEDDFNGSAYMRFAPENPIFLSPLDKSKVVRGSPLSGPNQTSRSAGRWYYDPTKPYGDLGFRVVRMLPKQRTAPATVAGQ